MGSDVILYFFSKHRIHNMMVKIQRFFLITGQMWLLSCQTNS